MDFSSRSYRYFHHGYALSHPAAACRYKAVLRLCGCIFYPAAGAAATLTLPMTFPAVRPHMQLPTYWDHNPVGWFPFVKAKFWVSGVFDETACFDLAVSSFMEVAIKLAIDLVECVPVGRPSGVLKDRLLCHHQMTPMQKRTN